MAEKGNVFLQSSLEEERAAQRWDRQHRGGTGEAGRIHLEWVRVKILKNMNSGFRLKRAIALQTSKKFIQSEYFYIFSTAQMRKKSSLRRIKLIPNRWDRSSFPRPSSNVGNDPIFPFPHETFVATCEDNWCGCLDNARASRPSLCNAMRKNTSTFGTGAGTRAGTGTGARTEAGTRTGTFPSRFSRIGREESA